MYFKNIQELSIFIQRTNYIGSGCQGTCYLNYRDKKVYKIFNEFLDEEFYDDKITYNKEEIMRFSGIANNTFIFPNDVIYVGDEIVGYITDYVKSNPLYQTNPLNLSLDKFSKNIQLAYNDIHIISNYNIATFDLLYNILYGDKFYVTDTDEFGFGLKDISYIDFNINNFNQELYMFLIDGLFDEFVNDYNILKNMYNNQDEDILLFLKLLRKYLSEYIGKDVKYLISAKKCLNKTKKKEKYVRII